MGTAIVITICVFFLAVHALLIETYRKWFIRLRAFKPVPDHTPAIFFTVVIPARNEEKQIEKCVQSILTQKYPVHLFEVVVADDYSTDQTGAIVGALARQHVNLRLLQLEKLLGDKSINSYKKKAIELAVGDAKGDWIVTTDADCIVPESWLANLSNFIAERQPVFVASPVKIADTGSFVSRFQCLDFLSLQGVTAASVSAGFHTMCNGANLAYERKAFYEVGGFKDIDNIASGDDMLLMHKMYSRYKTGVQYLFSPTSIVSHQILHAKTAFESPVFYRLFLPSSG